MFFSMWDWSISYHIIQIADGVEIKSQWMIPIHTRLFFNDTPPPSPPRPLPRDRRDCRGRHNVSGPAAGQLQQLHGEHVVQSHNSLHSQRRVHPHLRWHGHRGGGVQRLSDSRLLLQWVSTKDYYKYAKIPQLSVFACTVHLAAKRYK